MKGLNIDFLACSALAAVTVLSGCSKDAAESLLFGSESNASRTLICLIKEDFEGKASFPDEYVISNVNLFAFDENDLLEIDSYLTYPSGIKDAVKIPVSLAAGKAYRIYAVANAGFDITVRSSAELEKMKYFMAYPDDCSRGIIMAGSAETVPEAGQADVDILLRRLMSKASVRIDRSSLNKDVEMYVSEVIVGNCPRSVTLFGASSISGDADKFIRGFSVDGSAVLPLNTADSDGLSGEVPLYLLENIQTERDKELCSYVEIHFDYLSNSWYSDGDSGLVYRFFLRDPEISAGNAFDVCGNCHYHFTLCLRGDALGCEDSWKVDKSALRRISQSGFLEIIPSGSTIEGKHYEHYYVISTQEQLHLSLAFSPADMKVNLREDLVEDELTEGRALWELSEDSRELSVTALGRQCLSLMEIEAGEPLRDSFTLAVEIL